MGLAYVSPMIRNQKATVALALPLFCFSWVVAAVLGMGGGDGGSIRVLLMVVVGREIGGERGRVSLREKTDWERGERETKN